jgi:hypothetical protein
MAGSMVRTELSVDFCISWGPCCTHFFGTSCRGKHTPPGDEDFRKFHKTAKDAEVDAELILPAVTIRDPRTYLESVCLCIESADTDLLPTVHCLC